MMLHAEFKNVYSTYFIMGSTAKKFLRRAMTESSFWLHSLSTVIVVEPPSPWASNLQSRVETITESRVVKMIDNETASMVNCNNGIRLTADPHKISIIKDYDVDFKKCNDVQVHDFAIRCVDKYQHAKYLGLGLNCVVSVIREKPEEWLTRHFLKPNAFGDQISMVPRLAVDVDVAVLNLNLGGGWAIRGNGAQEPAVIIECNLDYKGPFMTAAKLKEGIAQWTKDKTKITSVLGEIIKDE